MIPRSNACFSATFLLLSALLILPQDLPAQTKTYPWNGSYSFLDGQLIGGGLWQCLWLGYGSGRVSGGELLLQPMASTTAGETHSALIRSQFALGSVWSISVNVTTSKQLRTRRLHGKAVPAPNPWEAAWLIADMAPDGSAGLYFIFKPNGVELGAYRGFGQVQVFLDTDSRPAMTIGTAYTYRLVKDATMVTALINGAPVAAAPLSALSGWSLGNRIGLYTEDAAVRFGPVTVTSVP